MAKWRKIVAMGCTHGDLVHPGARRQALEFVERYKPEIRFDLGDMIDTACFRQGAAGTKDESHDPRDDQSQAIRWIKDYRPTHIAWGNHDWRLVELAEHPKAIVRTLASQMWGTLNAAALSVGAKTVPYHRKHGWFKEYGYAWGHGYEYNINALQSHVNAAGMPVVMFHLHHPHQIRGRNIFSNPSFCGGGLVDEEKLTYGHRRVASLTHGHGWVFGETNGTESHLWLAQGENGKKIHLPPGL